MTDALSRPLPNDRLRWLMMAIQHETGSYSLPLVLRQAGLDRYVGHLPPADHRLGALAEDYAALVQAIRTYYGLGARGMLFRIGREAFRQERLAHWLESLTERIVLLGLPHQARQERTLRRLAEKMARPDDAVRLVRAEEGFYLTDRTGDRTHGLSAPEPCCHTAMGEIAEALLWATGVEPQVEEISCRAAGAAECRFRIR